MDISNFDNFFKISDYLLFQNQIDLKFFGNVINYFSYEISFHLPMYLLMALYTV